MASHFSLETAAAFKLSFFYYIRLPSKATPEGGLIIVKNERPIDEMLEIYFFFYGMAISFHLGIYFKLRYKQK